jgi:hypothetical protein
MTDGCIHPEPTKRPVPGRSDVVRYRNRQHSTIIGDHGAIRILDHRNGDIVLNKPGADGRTI